MANLTTDLLREARSATLHYQAIGLQCGGEYVSQGILNGIALGDIPSAGGNRTKGIWGEGAMPIGPDAIVSLDRVNHLVVDNPGRDCFKIRRFWIELELGDGRRCTSRISTPTYTQPPEWLHAEGTGVPFGEPIRVEIRF